MNRPHHSAMMSFGDHLDDLRRRVVLALLGILPLFAVCLVFGGDILTFLTEPLLQAQRDAGEPSQMLATSPLEPFIAYLKVSSAVALLGAMPWVLLQVWLFVAPGLYTQERRFVYFLLPLSTVLTAVGMVFLYTVLLPISLFFLIVFGANLVQTEVPEAPIEPGIVFPLAPVLAADPPDAAIEAGEVPVGAYWINERRNEMRVLGSEGRVLSLRLRRDSAIAQEYRIGEYISLVFVLALAFAISSQLPVVMLLLSWVGLLTPDQVTPQRRKVMMGCTVAGALLTPQDPFSMVAMGAALYALFELGIVLMHFVPASRVAGRRWTPPEDDRPADDEASP